MDFPRSLLPRSCFGRRTGRRTRRQNGGAPTCSNHENRMPGTTLHLSPLTPRNRSFIVGARSMPAPDACCRRHVNRSESRFWRPRKHQSWLYHRCSNRKSGWKDRYHHAVHVSVHIPVVHSGYISYPSSLGCLLAAVDGVIDPFCGIFSFCTITTYTISIQLSSARFKTRARP